MKQMLVVRTDLNMRKGKMIAQGAHASLGAVLPYFSVERPFSQANAHQFAALREWLSGSFTKICVRVDSEEQLVAVHEQAVEADLIACLITDAGKTEFGGVPTKTCCAIGPATAEELEPITGGLKLL